MSLLSRSPLVVALDINQSLCVVCRPTKEQRQAASAKEKQSTDDTIKAYVAETNPELHDLLYSAHATHSYPPCILTHPPLQGLLIGSPSVDMTSRK